MMRRPLLAALLALTAQAGAPATEPASAAASRAAVPSAPSAPASRAASGASTASAAFAASAASTPASAADAGPSAAAIVEASAGIAALVLCGLGAWLAMSALGEGPAPRDPPPTPPADGAWPLPREGLAFRRHWGSFGGESTGWNISPRLARLATGLAIGFAGVCLLFRLLEAVAPSPAPAADRHAAPEAASAPASRAEAR